VLVNVAAIVPFKAWDDIDFAEWRRIMAVNLDGTFLTNHYASKAMRENNYGRIVNIASNVILAGTPNLAHYVASKGGVYAFTRALARELGPHGITVNSVAPGLTATEGVMASKHAESFEFVQMLQCIPRRGEAADIAPAVAFLASEEAGWVTGQLLVADGGPHAQLSARRAGAILAVADVDRSVAFYRDRIGFDVEALYDDPPYATLTLAGTRLSLAEHGHPAEDRPGVVMTAPADPARANVVLVVEVDGRARGARTARRRRSAVPREPYEPPWGGCRFFCVDPDGYLVEIEQPA
jgi:catechol 2,3-dioxygenase-like lactoylglutathione lyase family enzyme